VAGGRRVEKQVIAVTPTTSDATGFRSFLADFCDAIAVVRRKLWAAKNLHTSASASDHLKILVTT
jgi:hypothetical protein